MNELTDYELILMTLGNFHPNPDQLKFMANELLMNRSLLKNTYIPPNESRNYEKVYGK